MATTIIIISSILTLGAAVPYIIEIIRGNTKPRIASWLIWTVLTGIAAIASYSDGQIPSAILMAVATIDTGLVVILGYRYGDKHFERLDMVCLSGAVVGLGLW